jgi:diphthine synthase
MSAGLSLIGVGLHDERDLSLRAIEEARRCDALYVEMYTTRLDTDVQRLASTIGKPIERLHRSSLEENSEGLLEEARRRGVGVLVGGDCLAATTHISLIVDARKKGIRTRVVHGSSILTAVAETGLSPYKFGRTVTIPLPENGPTDAVLKAIDENKEHGLHTLVLLDLDAEADRCLTANRAIDLLIHAEQPDTFNPETLVVGAARLGSDDPMIQAGSARTLAETDFGAPPHVLIVPGDLHFQEAEALKVIGGCPESALVGRKTQGELDRLIEKYVKICRGAFDGMKLRSMASEVDEGAVKDLIEHAERYLRDAMHYAPDRKPTALASVSYCEGILDALRLLGLVDFEW